ncbi:hypothetical protein ILYODFUR_005897 [Ilyodon furcidens]|uniref:C2H2-type domain-containing protein n=1 Tax=Ilyodon furcidens TaxID=33524 RepID=A0ABV0TSB6_9TELE
MQEAEFLKLLRSTFPQLAADRPFEYFMTNLTKKLLPLNLESITPEQICSAAGSSDLYIRLKPVQEEVQASQKNPKQRKAVDHKDDKNNSSSTTKQTMPKQRNATPHKQWVRETDTHINLRIHLLEDSKIKAVTPEVLKKYKLHKLQCPREMKEADFLRLLKSTLPKLAAQTYFETFKSDQHRQLLPLNVTSFTPELLSAAAGNSALYIRLKHPMNLKTRNQVTLQKTQGDAHPSSPHPATPKPENGSPSCNRVDDKDPHINLSICFLEDSHVDVLAPPGEPAAPSSSNGNPNLFFNKYPIHELKCPRGLQETDFLDLLKSTFPQLADGQPLTVLALQGRKMLPLKVDSVIPEEIRRASNSVRSPVICIQLTKKPLQKEGSDPADLPTTTHPSTSDTSIQSPSTTSGGPPNCELDNLLDLRFCILDDLNIDVLSPLALQKYPIVEFQCPGNLQKAEFLNLLRSTFPQLAGEAFEFLTGHGKNVRPINLENLTSDEFSRTLRLAGSSVLYIRLKKLRKVQASVKRTLPDVSDQSGVCPSKRVKKRRKRAKVRSSKSHRDEESENDETEDSEDDNEQKNSKSAKLLGLESLMPKYKARSEIVNLTDESSDATANIQIDDETDDSEDENYYKNPQFSRLSFLHSHIPGYSPEQNTETEPVKKMKEEQSSAKVSSQAEDEETEDSEDYNEHENLESSRLLSFPTKRSGDNTKQNTIKEHVEKKEVKRAAVTHGLKIEQVKIVDCEDRDDDKKAESTKLSSLQPQISGQVPKQSSSTQDVIVVEQNKDIDTPNITTNVKIDEVEFIHSDDDTGESCRTLSPQPQTSNEDSEQHNTTDPFNVLEKKDLNHSDANLNSKLGISTTTNKNMLSCKVCKVLHSSRRILARHAWRHVDDQSRLCGVCGKQFNSASAIRYHLETYQKTHKCKICDKTLLSLQGFKGHMNRHKGKEDQHQHPEPAQE